MYAIKVENLHKIYKKTKARSPIIALDNVSINVKKGTIFGLLGLNGAGKTTLIKILMGLVMPTSGEFSLLNAPQNEVTIKANIGFLPENHNFPKYLTSNEFLRYFGLLSGLKSTIVNENSEKLLKLVGLYDRKNSKIKTFSKGMLQRLGIAQALINDPELIFLDEPTDGLDPIARKEIRDLLISLKNQGKTLFLNSHLLSEIELVCDSVAFLDKGKLIKEGNINELTNIKFEYNLELSSNHQLDSKFDRYRLTHIHENKYYAHLNDESELNNLIDDLRKENINILQINQIKKSLEELFINLVKNEQKYE